MNGQIDNKEEIDIWLKVSLNEINLIYSILPKIFFYQNKEHVEASYTYNQIKNLHDENKFDQSMIAKFLSVAKITYADVESLFTTTDDAVRKSLKSRFERAVKLNLFDKFRQFYTQEDFDIELEFNSGKFSIVFTVGDRDNFVYTSLSE